MRDSVSLETNRSDREAESLMRRAIVDRIEIDQRQLLGPLGANQEDGLGLALTAPATVREDVRPGAVVRELGLVVAEQSQREIVAACRLVAVVPSDAVHARVREVLISLLTEQTQEIHLHHPDRLVGDLWQKQRYSNRRRQVAETLRVRFIWIK